MSEITAHVAGCTVIRRGSVGSTNDEAKNLAAQGCAARTVIWAEEQTRGKGRHGRIWTSPPGNLYLSVVLRPRRPRSEGPQVGFMAALAIAEAIDVLVPDVSARLSLKWPNDVLIEGAKVSGILMESDGGSPRSPALVLGMGVNVASHPTHTDRPATSLRKAGYNGAVETLLQKLLGRLVTWLDVWEADGFARIREGWLARATTGNPITVRIGPESLSGRFVGLDDHGGLILADNGHTRVLTAGEVFENAG